ncbi:succinyl-diaminopimelate desuccinylase [Glycocaulis alkaliphilus]|uniref:Succinyl-diaminopimelate desuccinylase n=1 Tax=Glycocaulis alkaliphilus TaxID=1434191 RepID=A0A3T0E856_9PROT|nr:succinyl-diaminopimelate desuccinylase [Glycocaulis alkaliphilus]AZU03585.1 succinyl-diaminopimelate desuccinylase [Glycocaulis alkaliphilus]GGB74679.1 succinyl-diaminopimelate desuccinylase [Glycocaulis alkaliphilus]
MTQRDTNLTDPLPLAQALIRAPSVTPRDEGALDTLQSALSGLGFTCQRMPFGEVDNLYARLGTAEPVFCFAGHTDVVPAGQEAAWSAGPFAGEVHGEALIGRGAVDMKGAIAAFVAATARYLDVQGKPAGSIAFLITGDEEGPAINGTKKMLQALDAQGERFSHCLVGEPTNRTVLGDMVKIGRRGSLNGVITVTGRQGHVAYPDRAINPIPALMAVLAALTARRLDEGNAHFQPSNLEVTSVDVGNPAHNVIPGEARAKFNIRFNTEQDGEALKSWINDEIAKVQQGFAGAISADLTVTGDAFQTAEGPFTALLADAIHARTGIAPELSTSGGTSDARFIKDYAPVAEFGLVGASMHQIDEQTPVADIKVLTEVYHDILMRYFEVFA